jgi:CHAT domain-containing protein
LWLLRQQAKARKPKTMEVAVLADPVFDADDARVPAAVKVASLTAEPAPPTSKRLTRSVLDLGTEAGGVVRLQRLPGTREEANGILSFVPPGKGMAALDYSASLATATSPELANYRIVHFATHGLLNAKHPELSGVVLSMIDKDGRPQDGYLGLEDVYNMNLPIDLVVLSGCQTALGPEIHGEGVIGLPRGFLHAGASRVVTSLWKVDDLATARIMKRFYRAMQKDHLSPAAALRRAQMEMQADPDWAAPYYWAAFQMQGEWR